MNYVEHIRGLLGERLEGIEEDLLDLYTLLAIVKGAITTNEDVHDAWSIWQNRTMPDHRSIIPYDRLSPGVQDMDTPYRDAIRDLADRLV